MNVWKPIAICAVAAFVGSVGIQVARAEGACHNQPHMAQAKEYFRLARAELSSAEHNKGGWRDRAIEGADKALRETTNGCEFADTH